MSKRFFRNSALCGYEALMQELPSVDRYSREDKRKRERYLHILRRLMDELDYSMIWERVEKAAAQMLFEDFAFKDARHRSAFYAAYSQYISLVGNNHTKNSATAVIYLLTASVRLKSVLSQYIANKTYVLPERVRDVGEEGYNLYHMARKIAGLGTRLCDEDITEPEIIEESVLCLYMNALFLQRLGLSALSKETKKKKPAYINHTGKTHDSRRYSYKDQAVKIKL